MNLHNSITIIIHPYKNSFTEISIHLGDGPFPGMIDIFGGAGGIIELRAALLASHGFAALALPYFNYDDLPKMKDLGFSLDLEYFEVIFVMIYYFDKFLFKLCVLFCCISIYAFYSKSYYTTFENDTMNSVERTT